MDGSTIYDGCADILTFLENSNNSSWAPPSSSSLHGTMMMNFDQEPQLGVPSDPERNRCDTSMAALLRATTTEGSILGTRDVEEFGEEELDGNRHNQSDKKRRLTQAQVKSLEKSFEEENKLEPERKVELAKKLGLQPRQVSIWFQNRRARYKSKQIEKEYDTLKANYDRLKEDYASLYKEMKSFKTEADYWKSKYEESVGNESNSKLDIHVQLDEGVTSIGTRGKVNETGAGKVVILSTKQAKDMSSTKSDIFDYESPQCMSGNQFSSLPMECTSSLPMEAFSSLPMEPNSSLPVEACSSQPMEASSTLMRDLDQQLKFTQDDEEQMMINNTLLLPQTPPTFNNFLNNVPEDMIYDPNANSYNLSQVDDQPTMWPWLY